MSTLCYNLHVDIISSIYMLHIGCHMLAIFETFKDFFYNSYLIAILLHAIIVMLHVDITILHVNIFILHVDIFDSKINSTQMADICHYTK